MALTKRAPRYGGGSVPRSRAWVKLGPESLNIPGNEFPIPRGESRLVSLRYDIRYPLWPDHSIPC